MPTQIVPHCRVCGCAMHDALTTCAGCETSIHQDCYEYYGGCPVYGCRGNVMAPEEQQSGPVLVISSSNRPPYHVLVAGMGIVVGLLAVVPNDATFARFSLSGNLAMERVVMLCVCFGSFIAAVFVECISDR